MGKIVSPLSTAAVAGPFTAGNLPEAARVVYATCTAFNDASTGVAVLNSHTASALNRLDAAHGGRLSALLNGAQSVKTAGALSLPEWAKATPEDLLLLSGKTWSNEADPLNWHVARVLARQPTSVLANAQAEARESEAVAEVARLRSENAAYETSLQEDHDRIERLTKELEEPRLAKIEAAAFERRMIEAEKREADLQAHAAKLEAMLTVEGADGLPVRLWLPVEQLVFGSWQKAQYLPIYGKRMREPSARQTPALPDQASGGSRGRRVAE